MKKKHNQIYKILNAKREIIATVNNDCNIEHSLLSSAGITIIALTTDYSSYKKREEQYIRQIEDLFK